MKNQPFDQNLDKLFTLLEDTYTEDILHLHLRVTRDRQAPRFKKLKKTHPKILTEFEKARERHTRLYAIRTKRMAILRSMIEEWEHKE